MKIISKFHLITQDIENYSHPQQVIDGCSAGANWIQLRCKKYDFNTWLAVAQQVKKICDEFSATLIINDSIEIAKIIKASGIHVGKQDESIFHARNILGNDAVIGFSCNTFSDIEFAVKHRANYVGLGPYRFTTNRENLNPILGLEGVKHVMRDYIIQNFTIPVIAIGGIMQDDYLSIAPLGIYGVAASSAIHKAENKTAAIKSFLTTTESSDTILTNSK